MGTVKCPFRWAMSATSNMALEDRSSSQPVCLSGKCQQWTWDSETAEDRINFYGGEIDQKHLTTVRLFLHREPSCGLHEGQLEDYKERPVCLFSSGLNWLWLRNNNQVSRFCLACPCQSACRGPLRREQPALHLASAWAWPWGAPLPALPAPHQLRKFSFFSGIDLSLPEWNLRYCT